ncbi:MAG: aspartate kinase [Anaerolineae bacterium]|nr:aspartate kinase [Anaerolineae bacterium]
MHTLTMKFGGTSVGTIEALRSLTEIIRQAQRRAERVAIVVSAMSGVTDLLQEGITSASEGRTTRYAEIEQTLRMRHSDVLQALAPGEASVVMAEVGGLITDFVGFCDSVSVLGEVTPRTLDYTMGLGERMSVRQVAAVLRGAGIPAQAFDSTDLIVTDDRFQDAAPLMDESRANVHAKVFPALDAGKVAVVTGFIGATRSGIATTLGRGGSDYSGAIIAACLDSDELWIWTDVPGVMSTDPRIVPEAHTIDKLTYREVTELAYFGAKVLHPKTIRPVSELGMPIRVKDTFHPDHPGTLIVPSDPDSTHPLKAVTVIRNVAAFTLEGKGMQGVPGVAGRTFDAVARAGASILVISQSSSEQSIFFVIPDRNAAQVASAIEKEFSREMARQDIDTVMYNSHYTIVTVVGSGMRDTPGVAGRLFSALGQHQINVVAIAMGSSDCSLSLAVASSQADDAIRAIHELAIRAAQPVAQ